MSPSRAQQLIGDSRFPRVSGDEPALSVARLDSAVFSPRERG